MFSIIPRVKQVMLVREFVPEDAESLSRMIVRNLRQVIIRDYSSAAVEALVPFYTPGRIVEKSKNHHMVVCVHEGNLVGTASLDGDRIRNVFVDVDMHRQGVGRLLMAAMESFAQENNLTRVHLHSGISAQGFYRALGYEIVEHIDRELDGIPIPEIKMDKRLTHLGLPS